MSLTGERGRVTLRAAGGVFLVPLRTKSRDRFGVVVKIKGSGGASFIGLGMYSILTGLFTVEYRLLEEFGTLKFGVEGEGSRTTDLAGPP